MKLLGLLLVSFAAAVAQAQTAATPDVAILANVQARELRFEQVPDVRIVVSGNAGAKPAQTVSHSERRNLPDQVQPRVIYRDIGIRLTITSTLPDIETIVDEALGTAPAVTAPPAPAASKPATRKKSKQ